jgi:hypothetical protein
MGWFRIMDIPQEIAIITEYKHRPYLQRFHGNGSVKSLESVVAFFGDPLRDI